MILDEQNNEVFYWPIANLVEGENSESIIIKIPTPSSAHLTATSDVRVKVWAKWTNFPLNPFSNINDGTGINLAGIPGPYGEFELYVEALDGIDEGFVRVPLSVIAAKGIAAGWLS